MSDTIPLEKNMTMTKSELISALSNTWQFFILGILLPDLVPDEGWMKLANKRIHIEGDSGPKIIVLPDFYEEMVITKENRNKLIGEYVKALKRAVLSEGHELILLYCEETEQFELYKSVSWFQFARIIRNVVSHKSCSILREWPDDLRRKNITSVSWNNRVIDISMIGQEITFTHVEAIHLIADQINFVQEQLT